MREGDKLCVGVDMKGYNMFGRMTYALCVRVDMRCYNIFGRMTSVLCVRRINCVRGVRGMREYI